MAKSHQELKIKKDISAQVVINGTSIGECYIYATEVKEGTEQVTIVLKDKSEYNSVQITFSKPILK